MDKALYFMPDISGFTKFVNNTELEHSIHIISELLELLIDSKTIDLKLVEIEGDALFMFTTEIPNYKKLIEQTTTMLEAFHTHIGSYETMRICNCGSCKTTTNLELKFLVHYGDLAFMKVKNFVKPYGRDVIKIHRLLKNHVPINEYLLFTNDTYLLYEKQVDTSWIKEHENFDFGSLNYYYKNLGNIKKNTQLKFEATKNENLEMVTPILTLEKIVTIPTNTIYRYVSELKYRHLWDTDAKRIDFDSHKVNRVGTEHNCVLPMGNLKFETIASKSSDSIIYGEKTKDMLFTKNFSYLIKLTEIGEHETHIELNLFLEFTTLGTFMKTNILRMLTKAWKNKFKNLYTLTKKAKSLSGE